MLCTRPDVSNALSLTSRFQSDPGMDHWTAVKNILKYLKRTKDMFLVYGGEEELVVKGYCDASFGTDPDDRKSQTGYVFSLNGGAVSWKSCKQSCIAQSTMEAEYMAASEAANEGYWLKKFVTELGVFPSALDPMEIFCDNTGAIAHALEPRFHNKVKHIHLRFHKIREYIQDGDLKICKVHTDLNVADPLTKPLPQAKHDQHLSAMGVRFIPNVN
jgi:hypothetical protein